MRYKMNEEEKDMFETFRKLWPASRYILLLQAHSALAIEETARHQYGLLPESNQPQEAAVYG
jgi:hypothetical protein